MRRLLWKIFLVKFKHIQHVINILLFIVILISVRIFLQLPIDYLFTYLSLFPIRHLYRFNRPLFKYFDFFFFILTFYMPPNLLIILDLLNYLLSYLSFLLCLFFFYWKLKTTVSSLISTYFDLWMELKTLNWSIYTFANGFFILLLLRDWKITYIVK